MKNCNAKCEFCGRFGAKKGKWIDPRGAPYPYENGMTLELCSECWNKQNSWATELQEKINRDKYMGGWDYAIVSPNSNPKEKDRNPNFWQGFNDYLDGKPLPLWYLEWRTSGLERIRK